jgi:hypothetical protein
MVGLSLTEEEAGARVTTVRSWLRAITEPSLARWSNSSNRSSASTGVRSPEQQDILMNRSSSGSSRAVVHPSRHGQRRW